MTAASTATERPVLSARLVPRARAFSALALGCVVAAGIVVLVARPGAPTVLALGAVVAMGALIGIAALLERVAGDARAASLGLGVVIVTAAVLMAPLGYFFGPNSFFGAAVGLLLLFAGLLSRPGPNAWTSIAVYVALAGGELVVTVLVATGALPDASVTPLLISGHPTWHHVAAHAAAQGVFLAAFLAGRALRIRYAAVAAALDVAHRSATLREALLDEARAEYRRAVRLARRGALSRDDGGVGRVSEPPALRVDGSVGVDDAAPSARTEGDDGAGRKEVEREREGFRGSETLWLAEYRRKMRGQYAAVIGLCLSGTLIIGVLARNPGPMRFAWACMAAILVLAVVQRRGDESVYWPWALIGGLSVGPAYSFGLHSAFACVIAALLFVGGSFRAAAGLSSRNRRLPVLLAVVATHGGLFALIAAGVVPDAGNVAVLDGRGFGDALVHHLLLQALFVGAFFAGWAIDERYDALAREAARAAADASQKEAQLLRAGEEIDRVLAGAGEGLFTGDRVGHYDVGTLVASGTMGDVYEATDTATQRRVAIKLVRRQRAGDPVVLELFAREASALMRVRSPHVAAILEAGTEGGELPYIAMELIEGRTLSSVLRERGRLPLEEVRRLVADVARGVRDVHDAGVIHRDLKPHNIMWTDGADGARWKLVDFGVAQLHDVVGARAAGGTPQYMAPEVALGERVDPRADLYGIGLCAYRALTGRPAFTGSDPVAIARAALEEGPPDPTEHVELPRDVVLALRLALGPKATDRFATARELASAFEAAFDGKLSERHRERALGLLARAPWRGATRVSTPVVAQATEVPTAVGTP